MDLYLIIISGILLVAGLFGCIITRIPGTPLSFLGIILLHLSQYAVVPVQFLIRWAVVVIIVHGLNYYIPHWGIRKFAGSTHGVWGSLIGMVLGLYFGVYGIIGGAIVGAFVGELFAGKECFEEIHHAVSAFSFFILGTVSKIMVAGILIYYYCVVLNYYV